MKQELKRVKRNRYMAILIFIATGFILLGAFLQFLYYMPTSNNVLSDAIFGAIQRLIVSIHQNLISLEWLWAISPRPTLKAIATSGNIATFIIFLLFMSSAIAGGRMLGRIERLQENIRQAEDDIMKDNYKNN